jgi:hypothetical protein
MCIRCHTVEASDPHGLCPTCELYVQLETLYGLRRLGDYLAAWAQFDAWEAEHRLEPH